MVNRCRYSAVSITVLLRRKEKPMTLPSAMKYFMNRRIMLATLSIAVCVSLWISACGGSSTGSLHPIVIGPRAWAYRTADAGTSPMPVRVLVFVPNELLPLSSAAYNLTDDLLAQGTQASAVEMGQVTGHPGGVCYYFDFIWNGSADDDAQVIAVAGGARFWDIVQLSLTGMPAWPY